MTDETSEEYQARLKDEGVEIDETPETVVEDDTIDGNFEDMSTEFEKEVPADETPETKVESTSEDDKTKLQDQEDTEVQVKRSIYDEYKDKKALAKSETDRANSAEKERDELQAKIDGKDTDDQTPQDELTEFAKEIDADPAVIQRMREIIVKGLPKSDLSESLQKDLNEFKAWKSGNTEVVAKQAFDSEYDSIQSQLTKDYPTASNEEKIALKKEIDRISHTTEFHDKSLDYVVFKNKDKLSVLVSPKKKGMESSGNNDFVEETQFQFDPNADISTLSPKELEQWQKEYNKATSQDSLLDDGQGGKILL